jgi:CRISPR/Cas system-associated endonuclease Cas1
MDSIRKGYHPRQEACRDKDREVLWDKEDIKKRWAEHFKDALNKEYPRCKDQGELNLELSIEGVMRMNIWRCPDEEIEESIKKLKNGRAPGEDIIPEMIKYGGKQLEKKLQELICVIWTEEKMPAD